MFAYNIELTIKSKRGWCKCKCDSANRVSSDKISCELDCTPIALVSLSVCGYTAPMEWQACCYVQCLYMYIVCDFDLYAFNCGLW